MKHIFTFILIFAIFFQQNTFAQQSNIQDSIQRNDLKNLPKLFFNLVPLALIEPVPYLQVGVEYRLKNYWYLHHEAGWGFNYNKTTRINGLKGIRLQNSIRYYIPNNQHLIKESRVFVGLEFLFKNENYTIPEWYNMAGGAYSQRFDIKYTRTVFGLSLITGAKIIPHNSPVVIDIMTGVGVRNRNVSRQDPPQGAEVRQIRDMYLIDFFGNDDGNLIFPHLKAGVRIGFVIGK